MPLTPGCVPGALKPGKAGWLAFVGTPGLLRGCTGLLEVGNGAGAVMVGNGDCCPKLLGVTVGADGARFTAFGAAGEEGEPVKYW